MTLADDEVLLPGLVDTHVHVNEPGPHRVGGLRDRHPGGGRRRRHHPRRHAAQLHPADHDRRARWRRSATAATGSVLRRRRLLGRRGARQRRRPRGRCTTPACSASSASCRTRASRSSRTLDRGRAGAAAAARSRARRAAARARRGPATTLRAEPRGRGYARLPRLAAARRPRTRAVARGGRRWRGATGARVHIVHLSSGERAAAARAPPRRDGRAGHRGDLPALPDPHRRGGPRRRDRVQVLPADPRARQPGALWEGLARRHDRLRRLRPLALHRRLKRRDGDFAHGLGRHRSLQLGPAGRLDRGPRAAGTGWPTWSRWMADRPRRPGRAARARARSRPAATPTSWSSRRTRRSSSTRPRSTTATRSRRTPAGRSPASCGRPGCAAADRPDRTDAAGPRPAARRGDPTEEPHDRAPARPDCPTSPRAPSAAAWCAPTTSCSPRGRTCRRPSRRLRPAHVRATRARSTTAGRPARRRERRARRPGDRPARRAGRRSAASSSTPRSSPATTRRASVEAASRRRLPVARGAARRDVGRPLVPRVAARRATRRNAFAVDVAPALSRTCG